MPIVTAFNNCYYECDHILGKLPSQGLYKKQKNVFDKMKAETTDDFIHKTSPNITDVFDKKRKELRDTVNVKNLVSNITELQKANNPVPEPPAPIVPAGAGMDEEIDQAGIEMEKIKKDIIKNKSRSIIDKITNKNNSKKGKGLPIKITYGSGLMEI
jgi:hypothetical protein